MSVATTGLDRIAAAFAGHGKRAAMMPYLMGGYPDLEVSTEAGLAAADAGADLIELGVPFSDPLADGPVIHAAATEALAVGVTLHGVLGVCEQIAGAAAGRADGLHQRRPDRRGPSASPCAPPRRAPPA